MTDQQTVYVTGAGFSRAVSDSMPITDELGNRVIQKVWHELKQPATEAPKFEGGRFETWLSSLAEDQPYLSEVDNAYNRADLLRITRELFEDLIRCQQEALSDPPPWLFTFAHLADRDRATVITFNYDTILETAAASASANNFTVRLVPTIIKLHGSLDRFWIPGDSSSEPIQIQVEHIASSKHASHRSPFIVPPVAQKSSYYDTYFLRQQWQTAADALAHADRVALIGYSLPAADIVAGSMIRRQLAESDATLTVVSRAFDGAKAIADNVRNLGIESDRVTAFDGGVKEFVEAELVMHSRDFADEIRALDGDSDLVLRIYTDHLLKTHIDRSGRLPSPPPEHPIDPVVVTDEWVDIRLREGTTGQVPIATLRELLDSEPQRALRITGLPGGADAKIIRKGGFRSTPSTGYTVVVGDGEVAVADSV